MIKGKINVKRILKDHLFEGKNGKYLDLVIWEKKDGPDQYGNTHIICQDIGKEARDRGEKGPIIGNIKIEERQQTPPQRQQPTTQPSDIGNDDVPF